MSAQMGDITVVGEMVIEDVWYVVRHPDDNSLLSVGIWFPPEGDRVIVEKVDAASVPALAAELIARSQAE